MYLPQEKKIWLASGETPIYLEPSMANRHGLIAGATGTGKTVTLKVLAESFSDLGVPVFLADIKGDLSGMCAPGTETGHIRRSIEKMGLEGFSYTAYPVRFFDVYGEKGHPVRTTISEMGPELLARLLDLNETQSGVLRIIFRVADDQGLLLLDLKDLRSMTQYVGDHAKDYKTTYGNISPQTVGAIQRALLKLEDEGGNLFFGEPALRLEDWMAWDTDGRGMMNILECQKLFLHPLLYATFLLWMLSALYEMLPEVGDLDKPKLVFFFDEAPLLFHDAPKALLQQVEQVVRLIRSKGVSVWFISQQPSDLPDSVLSQIGNRVQHGLRAYTPNDQKNLRAAARSFRVNPAFDAEQALQELGTGEALVSLLDAKGIPTVVQKAGILPPQSSMEAAPEQTVQQIIASSALRGKYEQMVDRVSAYEKIEDEQAEEEARARAEADRIAYEKEQAAREKEWEKQLKEEERRRKAAQSSARKKATPLEKAVNSAANTVGRELGKQIIRGLFGVKKR